MIGANMNINRVNRRVLHGVWPGMVMGPLRSIRSNLEYYTRSSTFGTGLTPKEKKYVEKKLAALTLITEDLDKIYSRLKR